MKDINTIRNSLEDIGEALNVASANITGKQNFQWLAVLNTAILAIEQATVELQRIEDAAQETE